MRRLVSSESVSCGHPDMVAGLIADQLVTEYTRQDKDSHCGIEVLATANSVTLAGEVKSNAKFDVNYFAREAVKKIGYTHMDNGFNYATFDLVNLIHEQSPDIDQGVSREVAEDQGSGDQGIMFGYASDETKHYMPLTIMLARALTNKMTEVRQSGAAPYFRPDTKSQVSIWYEDGVPTTVDNVVIAVSHEDVDQSIIRQQVIDLVINPVFEEYGLEVPADDKLIINGTGKFVIYGPYSDAGVTGRKLVVENYGAHSQIGGGATTGKDMSKTDRSAAYYARYVAKNIVAAGFAKECKVQVAYCIGVADPVSVYVDTNGTGILSDEELTTYVKTKFNFRPYFICELFGRHQDFFDVTFNGAYGNDKYPWEQLDIQEQLLIDKKALLEEGKTLEDMNPLVYPEKETPAEVNEESFDDLKDADGESVEVPVGDVTDEPSEIEEAPEATEEAEEVTEGTDEASDANEPATEE